MVKCKFASFLVAILTGITLFSSDFIIYFTDKANSPFDFIQPNAFLSDRALERRNNQLIEIDSSDLPVCTEYVDSLQRLGINVRGVSRWLNAAQVSGDSLTIINAVSNLSFVSSSKKLTRVSRIESEELCEDELNDTVVYGQNKQQIYQLNGQYLHNLGFRGEGMYIGVIDGGFRGSDTSRAFQLIREENRLKSVYDFTFNDTNVFEQSSHGNNVFSIIGGNIESQYFGTAPFADFSLLKSEYVTTETLEEEFYLVRALEYADSAGIDVVNISLGYYTFDNSIGDHTWDELDGNTAIGSVAADKAASKGMIVVSSAGNEGNSSWKYISIPSDGDSVLSIAAVDLNGNIASFSSYGREEDTRIKPNIAAMGFQTVYVSSSGSVTKGNGTSYSAPLITGLISCLWQAFRDKNNMEIVNAVQRSSSQYFSPDKRKGYGIPDFGNAYAILNNTSVLDENSIQSLEVFPNPCHERMTLQFPDAGILTANMEIYNVMGGLMYAGILDIGGRKIISIDWPSLAVPASGVYILKINTNKLQYTTKLVKW